MAKSISQVVDVSNPGKTRKSVDLLPALFRTDKNAKFLAGTLDQFIQPAQLERIDGWVGSKRTPTYNAVRDFYLTASSKLRNDYQVEPALITTDEGLETANASSYDDLISQLKFEGANVSNLDRLLRPEFYSYNPRIDWDKFVNYDQYYWMPFGPDVVSVSGTPKDTISTYTVSDSEDGSYFIFTPDGLTETPLLTLYRGVTYIFNINSRKKFWFKTSRVGGTEAPYRGIDVNGISQGQIVFTVDQNTPANLWYVAEDSDVNAGQVVVKSLADNSTINVETDILGKVSYKSGNGISFTNGLRISFAGEVFPEEYAGKEFFVEGVGSGIKLIDVSTLETPEQFIGTANENFDATPFDDYPFDTFRNIPLTPDYITINRSSIDRNPWSRYNRWVHEDVIIASASANNRPAVLPVENRAKRPIIEFEPNLQLFNFATVAKKNVQHIDTTTTDAFSNIEGQLGFSIDGVTVAQGDRIIFTADADSYVASRIYVVNFVKINDQFLISLDEAEDSPPMLGEGVLVSKGQNYAGTSWFFNGTNWVQGQQKTRVNQAPLFDIFDSNENSYGNKTSYQSNFAGCKIFGYAEGTGTEDPILGFPLKYKSVANQAFYLFENYFMTDSSRVDKLDTTYTLKVKDGFIKKNVSLDYGYYVNVWTESQTYNIPYDAESDKYDTSVGWTNNPLNGSIGEFTLSELTDHALSMSQRHPAFSGEFFGKNNARDLPDYASYGTRLIKNKNPLAFAGLFLGGKNQNLIDAIRKVELQYNQFKLGFIDQATRLLTTQDTVAAVDLILTAMNKNKDISSSFVYSDMVAYGTDAVTREFVVTSPSNNVYGLVDIFKLDAQSSRSVLVYHESASTKVKTQLIVGRDYEFDLYDPSIIIKISLAKNDKLIVKDYASTDGCFVPLTPTKLGLYPKFVPEILVDTTYVNPTKVIQCHDGSIVVAFNDYRDDIILELERRIYNNIKVNYNPDLFNINDVIPGAFRTTDYSRDDINEILEKEFLRWSNLYGFDFQTNLTVGDDPKTWNYSSGVDSITGLPVTGNYRSIFKFFYDTDRPHTHPWEMLGFPIKPEWWEDRYGPAPYTSGNMVLWEDLEEGLIDDPNNRRINLKYARPGLTNIIPVDASGNLINPATANIVQLLDANKIDDDWKFGDIGPTENAWRRSSHWPFAMQILLALTKPANYTSLLYDTSRITKNLANQYILADNFPALDNAKVFSYIENGAITRTAGYSVFLVEANTQQNKNYANELKSQLSHVEMKLLHKVGGFVSKDKLTITIDSVNPSSSNPGVTLSNEDYEIFLDQSSPVSSIAVSGVIVQKTDYGYTVKGYDKINPYFNCLMPVYTNKDPSITVGGKTEPYVKWEPSYVKDTGLTDSETTTAVSGNDGYKFYKIGQVVEYNGVYYRVTVSHNAGLTFNSKYFQKLPALPRIGGVTVVKPVKFESTVTKIPYGKTFATEQEVFDLLQGYGNWLETNGLVFDEYQKDLDQILNWFYSGKEFLFWATQGWSSNSVISISPFANGFKYVNNEAAVESIINPFYQYSVFKVDGTQLPVSALNVNRQDGVVTITTSNTNDGIYFIRLICVQKEHSLIFENQSLFNDIIYDTESGYRQKRLQLKGFRTSGWNGDLYSPGFIYDEAVIKNWERYKDYKAGELVRYAGNYYSAVGSFAGADKFDNSQWQILGKKPVAQLLPNFDYKINQFEDFYSLDIDNFDSNQQALAQHLTGYSPRPYLGNIFNDHIAQYKFYQGFIREKGTRNSIAKLKKASSQSLGSYVDFYEEWAFRIGEYGAFSSDQTLEISLEESKFGETPQLISFVNEKPINPNEAIIYKTESDIVIKPTDYSSSPFATTASYYIDNLFKLPLAGYPRLDDVSATAVRKENLLEIANNRGISDGDTIWTAFKDNNSWDVYRYTTIEAKVTDVSILIPGNSLIVQTDRFHELAEGDLVSITQFDDQINGVYKVQSVPDLDQFVIESSIMSLITPFNPAVGLLFKFVSSRYSTIDKIAESKVLGKRKFKEKLWIDNDGTGKWMTLEKQDAYWPAGYAPQAASTSTAQQFAYKVASNASGSKVIASAPSYSSGNTKGKVFAFTKNGTGTNSLINIAGIVLNSSQNRSYADTSKDPAFGKALAIDDAHDVVIIGAPRASYVKVSATVPGQLNRVNYNGTTSTYTNQGLVKLFQLDFTGAVQRGETVVSSPNPQENEEFGSELFVGLRSSGNSALLIGAPGSDNKRGAVYYANYGTTATINFNTVTGVTLVPSVDLDPGSLFGTSISGDETASIVAVSAPGYNNNTGAIFIFKSVFGGFTNAQVITASTVNASSTLTTQTIVQDGSNFGSKVLMSKSGTYLFVSAPKNIDNLDGSGKVLVFKNVNGTFKFDPDNKVGQILVNPFTNNGYNFGEDLSLTPDERTLVITSQGSNNRPFVTFDTYSKTLSGYRYVLDPESKKKSSPTTFDSGSSRFYSKIKSGSVFTFNRFSDKYFYGQELFNKEIVTNQGYGSSVYSNAQSIVVGAPEAFNQLGKLYYYDYVDNTWVKKRYQTDLVDLDKVRTVRTIDTEKNSIVDYIEILDPLKGKIPGLADEEIKYKTPFDPAIYSIGVQGLVVDTNKNWLEDHVGELWWDLSSIKFIWYEQGENEYRKNNWGRIFPGCTVDVYEWVESEYLPSQWAVLADTSDGLAKNISGQPKFGDNSAISVKQVWNSVSNSLSNVYYYWVKNKVTVPLTSERKTSALDIAKLIADPKSQGMKFAGIVSPNSLILSHIKSTLVGNRVNLTIDMDGIDNVNNKHTEWLLLQEGNKDSQPNVLLKKKVKDSLLGMDSLGNIVPDPTLSDRQKYGIQIRPRQTLFKDRFGALRVFVEYSNSVFKDKNIVDSVNLDVFNKKEDYPLASSGQYDAVVEDLLTRDETIYTRRLEKAQLSASIFGGRVTGVTIENPGYGYGNLYPVSFDTNDDPIAWQGPTVKVSGDGTGAEITTVVDKLGRIISTKIKNSGKNYTEAPILEVRPFSVIVQADETVANRWSLYEWDYSNLEYIRARTQSYNTTLYWKYIDWADATYNDAVDFYETIEEPYQLQELQFVPTGAYVKIKNAGDGRFIIVRKTDKLGSYTNSYDLIYQEKGTIQISDDIWKPAAGFDYNASFDQLVYDQSPVVETANIVTGVNNIFDTVLKVYANKLFFKLVKYAFTEQKFLDWAFKTSFISVTNYAGELDQRPTYKLNDESYYQDYIKEAKPFHSKIRNFQTNYTATDLASVVMTDFDLPSRYDPDYGEFVPVSLTDEVINEYPWKSWADNYTYYVENIEVYDGGEGYEEPPVVVFSNQSGDTGSGAKAVAYIALGKVTQVVVTDPGSGYKATPIVSLIGGGNTEVKHARLVVKMANGLVRSNQLTIKFDRVAGYNEIDTKEYTDKFVSDGSEREYQLTWAPNPDKDLITVKVNGIKLLTDKWSLTTYNEKFAGYTKKYGKIVLNYIPNYEDEISITYQKDVSLYHAADRIRDFYTPTAGMPGNTATLLMSGLEYPQTTVDGMELISSTGFDTAPFEASNWDNFITEEGYYSTTGSTSTSVFKLNYVPALGKRINVYLNSVRIDDPYFDSYDGVTVQPNGRTTAPAGTTMQTFVGDGYTNLVDIRTLTTPSDVIGFRWEDSDASLPVTDMDLDVYLSGGDPKVDGTFAYGYDPSTPYGPDDLEDIAIDGDKLVSVYNSYGPEENLPGRVSESLGISVFTQPPAGSALSIVKKYITTDSLRYSIGTTPPSPDYIEVIYNGSLYYDWTVDYSTNELVILGAIQSGKILTIRTLSVGGANVIENFVLTVDNNTGNKVFDLASAYGDILDSYVTVNGVKSSEYTITGTLKAGTAGRGVLTFNSELLAGDVVQVWLFAAKFKAFSEVRHQIIQANPGESIFALDYPPGDIQPYHSQVIVERDGRRLLPPDTIYYTVAGTETSFSFNKNKQYPLGAPSRRTVEVYRNGQPAAFGRDYEFIQLENRINFYPNILNVGDVIAISILIDNEYVIANGNLYLTSSVDLSSSSFIDVYTFNNHDSSLIRRERFIGDSTHLLRLGRPVLSNNYLWVDLNGRPLVRDYDYWLKSDLITLEFDAGLSVGPSDVVTVMSVQNTVDNNIVLGYRMFFDNLGRTHYKRLSQQNTTRLAAELTATSLTIELEDASVLTQPNPSRSMPGVVLINGERIEFYEVNGNTLSKIRRGTLGTGVRRYYRKGTSVIDQGYLQTMVVSDQEQVQNIRVTENTTTYSLSYLTFTTSTSVENQIEVYYQGRLLNKSETVVTDQTVAYDSNQVNSLGTSSNVTIPAEFTATNTGTLVLSFIPVVGAHIKVVRKTSKTWYETGVGTATTNKPMHENNTEQVKFLLERPSALPDKYYYGKI